MYIKDIGKKLWVVWVVEDHSKRKDKLKTTNIYDWYSLHKTREDARKFIESTKLCCPINVK
jgi:hypothetical protein